MMPGKLYAAIGAAVIGFGAFLFSKPNDLRCDAECNALLENTKVPAWTSYLPEAGTDASRADLRQGSCWMLKLYDLRVPWLGYCDGAEAPDSDAITREICTLGTALVRHGAISQELPALCKATPSQAEAQR